MRWALRQPATIGLGLFASLVTAGVGLGRQGGLVAGVLAGYCALIVLVVTAFFGMGRGASGQVLLILLALALAGLVLLHLELPGGLTALIVDLSVPLPD